MRIAIVSPAFVPIPPIRYGGTERVIYYLIKGLKELGHEPILFAPGDSKVDCEVVPICEKSLYFGTDKESWKAIQKEADAIWDRTKKKILATINEYDIIHSHSLDLIDFQDYPNLTTLHGPIKLSEIDLFEERKNLFYVSISENQQHSFPDLQYMGIAYNGLDPEEFQMVEEPEDYLCFLGRFDQEKNPHLAIQLALKLGMKLKMAGKTGDVGIDYFKEEIEPHLSNPLIEYLGELDMKEKIDLISKAKCNLHPTGFREPFGLTVLEAAYCGTPTMAIDRGSMPELIEDGRTGILVEDFAEGYHHIQESFAFDRKYIAQRSRHLFNYQIMAKQYIVAYNKVTEIFRKKTEQQKLILDFMSHTKEEMKRIWPNG